jgi:hypothetical protein
VINNGEIAKIYFTTVGNPMANIANELEWDSRIDNSAAGASKIRLLTVIGEFPAVGDNEKQISGGRIIEGVKDFLINFTIDETSATNYSFLRQLECAQGNHLFWYETRDGKLFGGNSGVEGKIKLKKVIPKDYNGVITFEGTIKWKSQFSPEGYISSPVTSSTGNQ